MSLERHLSIIIGLETLVSRRKRDKPRPKIERLLSLALILWSNRYSSWVVMTWLNKSVFNLQECRIELTPLAPLI